MKSAKPLCVGCTCIPFRGRFVGACPHILCTELGAAAVAAAAGCGQTDLTQLDYKNAEVAEKDGLAS